MKINVYQIPLAFNLLGAAALVVLPLFGMTQAQANSIAVGIMLLGSFVLLAAVLISAGSKDGDK